MKAVILAAGRGTRMGALTAQIPKPMMPVRGQPILESIITGLRDAAGVREFFVIVGHQGHVIRDYFQDGSRHHVCMDYGEQLVQDGTGKAPELAKNWVQQSPFFLSYGDILVEPSVYAKLAQAFIPGGSGVIALKDGEDLSKGGAVILNEHGDMTEIIEKAAPGTLPHAYYNAGIYLFTPQLFNFTATLEKSPRGEYELTDALRALARVGSLRGVLIGEKWADVRDPEVLAQLNAAPP